MQKDGSIIDLTEGIGPRWSPDGTRVAFWANTPGGLNEIFIMDSEGSNARNLTNSASSWETRPVWSPNGSMVAFDAEAIGSGKGLGIITSDGMERHFVPTGTPLTNSAWFPDGGSLLFHTVVGSRIQIHSVRSDGTGEMPLTSDTTVDFSGGKISPNGVYFSYSRLDSSGQDFVAIIIRNLTSGQEDDFPGKISGTTWSPKSDWLYCTEISVSGHRIVRISPIAKIKQDLSRKATSSTYNDAVASLSSDGKWLAFTSDRSGPRLIYMMSADGSNQQQVTIDPQLRDASWKP